MHSNALDCFVAAIISLKQAAPAFFFLTAREKNLKNISPAILKKKTNRWSEQ